VFKDRVEAGQKLGARLIDRKGSQVVIIAIPRGGVVVGYQIALMLGAPLDIVIPRKIRAPLNPELAIGAVTEDGEVTIDRKLVDRLNVSEKYIEAERKRQSEEIRRRVKNYRSGRSRIPVKGKAVILTDDGVATGSTMKAAIMTVRRMRPKSIIVAVPVAPSGVEFELGVGFNEFICLLSPERFYAIGQFYRNFLQVDDEEVIEILKKTSS
jgi:putative phosphoribosyl transferase